MLFKWDIKNLTLLHSARRPDLRNSFFDRLDADGYDKVARRHLSTGTTVLKRVFGMVGSKLERLIQKAVMACGKILHVKNTEDIAEQTTQFIKFCMVGVTNSAVSYAVNIGTLFMLSRIHPGLKFDYIIANTTAFLISVYWSFFWNSRKVFHFGDRDRATRRKALLKTYMCYAFTGILLNNILSTFWIRVLGVSKLVAPLLNLMFTIPLNYLTNKNWAFAERRDKKSKNPRR